MPNLTDSIRQDREYGAVIDALKREFSTSKPSPLLLTGLCDGASDSLFVSLIRDLTNQRGASLIICRDERECSRLCDLLRVNSLNAAFYLPRDLTFYNISASHDYEHERLMVLYGLLCGGLDAVVTTPDAALGYTIPPDRLQSSTVKLDFSTDIELNELAKRLVDSGYKRVDLVDSAGQFACRGGIVDIFPPRGHYVDHDGNTLRGSYPIRVELFGNEIDRMGLFDPSTQRVTTNVSHAELPPSREVLANADDLADIRRSVIHLIKNATDERVRAELQSEESTLTAAISGSADVGFVDKYIVKIYPKKATLLDYFPSRSTVFVKNTEDVNDRIKATKWHSDHNIQELVASGMISPKYAEYSRDPSAIDAFFDRNVTLHIDSLARGLSGRKLGGMFNFRTRHTASYAGNYKLLLEDLVAYERGSWKVLIETENETESTNLCGYLKDNGFSAKQNASVDELEPGEVSVSHSSAVRGFELITPRVAVLSTLQDERIAGAAASKLRKKSAKKKSNDSILSYSELSVGDYVVHENYGIGQYEGIENLTVNGTSRDYINIRFAGADRLYLPTEKIGMLSKYIGARTEDGLVKLSKFGGAEWGKAKARAKAAVKEIAKDLIKLYAERSRRPGYAFPADDDLQRDFEASFEYEETDSQLTVTHEIKDDMIKPVPMDRLLCGDVGFGKTEVALRAAYKAVLGGKQVAILVPTTILALQHYQTALSRMRSFAVSVDMVSRFRTPKQQAATLRALKRGDVDVIIGTHRLLSKDVEFNDLGLLIVDEEQRFGVTQKEKIKQMSGNIDVLTLTATPIPRTLNMAMGGIRDISILDEAPGDRLPIQTYVLEDDDLIIFEAIRRELQRGGQVFYLHNNIETIDNVASKLLAAFPDARITTAHGRMDKDRLEDIWHSMLVGETDILICTSIIETGVDVPNANTLIVDNAHRLGLSQLHQIRGRVGRSSRRAYAYFTFPKNRALSEIAEKRLEALREYSEFGAGFRIALRDLELRGAGNLLGAEQHGHLDAIGYELYIKLLHDAVLEEQGKPQKAKADCTVSLDINAFIPEKYVRFQPQRMTLYKRIATVTTPADRDDLIDELSDRYGDVPVEVQNLLDIAILRSDAISCGFTKITQNGGEVTITPEKFELDVWQELADVNEIGKLRVVMSAEPSIVCRISQKSSVVETLNRLFEKYTQISRNKGRQSE